MLDNCITIFQNLPYKIKGFAVYNSNEDYYTIVLNSRLSHDQNLKTYIHELEHITNDDFHSGLSATKLETIAH